MASVALSERLLTKNVFANIQNSQLTGKSYTTLQQFPLEWLQDFNDNESNNGIPSLIKKLNSCSVYLSGASFKDFELLCLESLKTILQLVTNYEARQRNGSEGCEEEINKNAKLLIENNVVAVLTRILMFETLFPPESHFYLESQNGLRLKALCLEIFSRMISTNCSTDIYDKVASQDDLMVYLFSLLIHDKTFIPAAQLIEDILQEEKVFNLTKIRNLRTLLSAMDDERLANFCRILAVTISDLDIYDNKSSLYAQNKQKRSKGFVNNRDINQEYLLSFSELLPRIVRIITHWEYTPRYRNKATELDCWMEWINNAISDIQEEPTSDDLDEFVGGVSAVANVGGLLVQQPGNKVLSELVSRVQVVYVLGLFLVGKHRKKVQRKLAELKLIPGLSELFEEFIWKCQNHPRTGRSNRLRGHHSSCECSPEVALKIQFLRLVHSFCDHSEYKHLMLSNTELNEVKRINAKAGPLAVNDLDKDDKQLMCKGSRGLLTKIVDIMKKEPVASTFRFWLARAVESYLRGHTSYCDQIFLLRRGILPHVAGNMIDHDIRPKEIVQSSFDLLGELMKFNIEAFKQFDKLLSNKERTKKFRTLMNRNLVDSNMFIRSIMLSLNHFTNTQPEYKEYANKHCTLLNFVMSFNDQLDFLQRMIKIIDVKGLTQENVSCLNTTLVFLMFARRRNELPKYLYALKDEKLDGIDSSTSSVTVTVSASVSLNPRSENIMKNFRDLLVFWQEHYLHKDKDCSALEKSSRISFDFWKDTVITLVSDNRNCDQSLVHYIPPCSLRDN